MAYERCYTEHERRTTRRRAERRRRVRRRVERCGREDWWNPATWWCWFETVVRTVVETFYEEVVEWVEVTRCVVEETPSVIGGIVAAVVLGLVNLIIETIRAAIEAIAELLVSVIENILGNYRICSVDSPPPAGSVERLSASAFSMAGGQANARDYRDDGVWYQFEIRGGMVFFRRRSPSGMTSGLVAPSRFPNHTSISFHRRRSGDISTDVSFDMIAASRGRVFVKAAQTADFFFTAMDEMFVHREGESAEFTIPSIHFQNDPEKHLPGAQAEDLVAALQIGGQSGFMHHPAAERFPLFRRLLRADLPLVHLLVVGLVPRVWHRLDTRPPWQGAEIPTGIPTRNEITYCPTGLGRLLGAARKTPESIAFDKVLGIGVGHVHLHEPYLEIYGGEIQPLLDANLANALQVPLLPTNLPLLFHLYRFFNGPVRDGDGFVDGTCNFYALVRLDLTAAARRQDFALLWTDEQTAFSKRWRLVHPRDCQPTDALSVNFALAASLRTNPSLYPGWREENFWCPFEAGHISENSRLAVGRYVLLVNGLDRKHQTEEIYSLNFSYASIDRTWRWRKLPPDVATKTLAGGQEIEPDANAPQAAYLNTIELREDMILSVRGKAMVEGEVKVGRWYQRYLSASLELVGEARGDKPSFGYNHDWQFIPEETWRRVEKFRFFGCYEQRPDSRTQYYEARVLQNDSAIVDEAQIWTDIHDVLSIMSIGFNWEMLSESLGEALQPDAWLPVRHGVFRPPSLYNDKTQLRLLKRGKRLLAVHADKRDDDLDAFDGTAQAPGATLHLEDEVQRRILVNLRSNTRILHPPLVHSVRVTVQRTGADEVVASIRFVVPRQVFDRGGPQQLVAATRNLNVADDIWQVKVGLLDSIDQVRILLDVERERNFTVQTADSEQEEHLFEWRTSGLAALEVEEHCTPRGQMLEGTSVWFVNVIGQVSVADKTIFD